MLDYGIVNALLVDGSGREKRWATIGIQDGQIAYVGQAGEDCPAREIIDAKGKYVFPGFMDLHTHSDHTLFLDGRGMSFLRQGIVLDNIGNCGLSSAPLKGEGQLAKNVFCYTPTDRAVTWGSMADYFQALAAGPGLAYNVTALVGHGALRSCVMGYANRPATEAEIQEMCQLLQQCFDQGAAGFSTGLEYFPGSAATQEELLALCRVTAQNGRLYATHVRNRDRFYQQGYQEAIDMARATDVRLQISHAIPKYGVPEEGAQWILETIQKARASLDIAYDVIPFLWGPTNLTAVLPPQLLSLPAREIAAQLRLPAVRDRLRGRKDCIWQLIVEEQWDFVKLKHCSHQRELIGKSFREIGQILGKDPFDALMLVIAEEGEDMFSGLISGRLRNEKDAELLIQAPFCGVISDAMALANDGPLASVKWSDACYSWVRELFQVYVREKRLFTLEEAARRITSLPAQRLKLKDMGLVEPGYRANIAIIDLDVYLAPRGSEDYAEGVAWLFINGRPVIQDDRLICQGAGRVCGPEV